MFDELKEKLRNALKSRLMPVTCIYVVLITILIYRLFVLQILSGEDYEKSFTKTSSQTRTIQATRGNIYDVNGKLLAYNELAYNVVLLDTGVYSDSQVLNAKIAQVIDIVESHGGTIDIDDFGLDIDEKGNVTFSGTEKESLRFKRDVFSHSNVKELTESEKNATAEQVFHYLRYDTSVNSLKFKISKDYTKQEAYEIMEIRFAMYLNNYTKYNPLVIARDVSDQTVAAVKEYSGDISGLDIQTTTIRKYNPKYSYSMAHILGYTGKISEEDYAEKSKDENTTYSADDQVGKTGVEAQFEDELHGVNGYDKVLLGQNRRIVDVKEGKQAVAGKDITLSINADLQNAAYGMMEKELAGILLDKIVPSTNIERYNKKSEKEICIPIRQVYYSLIKNGVINVEEFHDEDATDTEKRVYNTFLTQRKNILKKISNILSYSDPTDYNKLNGDQKDYVDYIYKMLVKKEVLKSSLFNGGDNDEYNKYVDGKMTLSAFLQHALSQDNWIDRTKFSKPDAFYNSEEIYNELLSYILTELSEDEGFSKMVYKTLVYNGDVSASQICLLLFDQNVIKYNKDDYAKAKRPGFNAYGFIRNKINTLEITPGQLGLDPCSGSTVITDPNTGKVQAMVSYPGYNNNLLANKIDSSYYSYLTNNSSYPLINRPIQQKTAPGSTYKMVSAITGLETGTINAGKEYFDGGKFTKVPPEASCWKKSGHGRVNVVRALEVSCNVFFYNLSYDIGSRFGTVSYNEARALNALKKYATQLGFADLTGVEIPNEARGQISTEQGITSYIGQGKNNYTPATLARYITTLANRGTVYDLSILKDSTPKVFNKLNLSSNTWALVSKGNKLVVNGAGSTIKDSFKNVKVEVAGKTGTAQESKKRPNHALFVSYAPCDKPEVTITTVIPNGYTSHNSAELAANIYEYYFADDKAKEELIKKNVTLPKDSTSSNE